MMEHEGAEGAEGAEGGYYNAAPRLPELVFPSGGPLKCLQAHGRHRIQAGKEILPARDKWWTVNPYFTGIEGLRSVG